MRVQYRVPVNGRKQFYPLSFLLKSVVMHNLSGDTLNLDNGQDPMVSLGPGLTQTINFESNTTQMTVWTSSNTTGEAWIETYDSPQTINSNPNSGTQQVSVTSGLVTINGPITIQAMPDVNIASMPNVAIASMPNVSIASMPNVNVGSGTINIQNVPGGLVGIVNASPVPTHLALNNATASIVLSRAAAQIQLQCRTDTLLRGGLLTVLYQMLANDATTQPYYLLQNRLYYADSYGTTLEIPYQWDVNLPSGSTIIHIFSGAMEMVVTY